jgi:outer membrane lipoprotein-sorting protein
MRSAFTVCLLLLGLTMAVRADTLDDVLNKMDRAGSQFKGMAANLTYTKHTALVNIDSVSTGTIKIKRPQPRDMRMLVDYTAPDKKTVWFEGHTVDILLPNIKTVQEYDIGKNKDLLEQFFLVGFGTSRRDLSDAYNISLGGADVVDGESVTRISMTSKNPEVQKRLTKFELWISGKTGQPVQQKFYEPSGDYNVFTYTNMKINPDLPDSALKPRIPKDYKKEYPNK